jgi:hypothetical protein
MERSLADLAGPFRVAASNPSLHAAVRLVGAFGDAGRFQTPGWVSNGRLTSIIREKSLKFGAIWARLERK